jgi:hypothetical protein
MSLQHEDEHIDLGDDEDDEELEEWSGFHSLIWLMPWVL